MQRRHLAQATSVCAKSRLRRNSHRPRALVTLTRHALPRCIRPLTPNAMYFTTRMLRSRGRCPHAYLAPLLTDECQSTVGLERYRKPSFVRIKTKCLFCITRPPSSLTTKQIHKRARFQDQCNCSQQLPTPCHQTR